MNKHLKHAVLAVLVITTLAIGNAYAGTASSNLSVSANVSADCSINATAMGFGTYDPVSANSSTGVDVQSTANLFVGCTNGAAATITLDQGQNPSGASNPDQPVRQMTNGSGFLTYFLYQDSEHTTVWGGTTDSGQAYLGTGSGSTLTVYGVTPRGQNVPTGTYNDLVVATISF